MDMTLQWQLQVKSDVVIGHIALILADGFIRWVAACYASAGGFLQLICALMLNVPKFHATTSQKMNTDRNRSCRCIALGDMHANSS